MIASRRLGPGRAHARDVGLHRAGLDRRSCLELARSSARRPRVGGLQPRLCHDAVHVRQVHLLEALAQLLLVGVGRRRCSLSDVHLLGDLRAWAAIRQRPARRALDGRAVLSVFVRKIGITLNMSDISSPSARARQARLARARARENSLVQVELRRVLHRSFTKPSNEAPARAAAATARARPRSAPCRPPPPVAHDRAARRASPRRAMF